MLFQHLKSMDFQHLESMDFQHLKSYIILCFFYLFSNVFNVQKIVIFIKIILNFGTYSQVYIPPHIQHGHSHMHTQDPAAPPCQAFGGGVGIAIVVGGIRTLAVADGNVNS